MTAPIDRVTAKGQVIPLMFTEDAVAASQTNAQMVNINGLANDEYPMVFDGEIIGMSYTLDAAGTTGTLDIGVTKNGTEDADTTKQVTTTQRNTYKFPRGSMKFVAGDRIGVEITTSADWAPATSDLSVIVYALVYLEGI